MVCDFYKLLLDKLVRAKRMVASAQASCGFLLLCFAAQSAAQEPGATADLAERYRQQVVQVHVLDNQADSKSMTGTGFFAGRSDWLVTNYHVIASLINTPGKYYARYIDEEKNTGQLTPLAVDIVHDLAIMQVTDLQREPFVLAKQPPVKGSRIYSMGYPYSIGLTIVEGTYNGLMEKAFHDKVHYTGSINPGMSGGPAFNEAGQIVGVNVSTAGNQVSFLVPVKYLAPLVRQAADSDGRIETIQQAIGEQLHASQNHAMGEMLAAQFPTTQLEDYTVPAALAQHINCGGDSEQEDQKQLGVVFFRCQSNDEIFLTNSMSTGVIRYQHELVRTEQIPSYRFYKEIENRGQYPHLLLSGDEDFVTNYRCHTQFLDDNGFSRKTTFCARTYLDYPNLYDVYLTTFGMVSAQEALQSTLVIAGVDWSNAQKFTERFLQALTWQP